MKRFLVFTGYNYYPDGGWQDFSNSYETLEEAKLVADESKRVNYDWAHVVDMTEGKIVYEK